MYVYINTYIYANVYLCVSAMCVRICIYTYIHVYSLSLSLSLSLSHTHTHTHVFLPRCLSLSHTHTHVPAAGVNWLPHTTPTQPPAPPPSFLLSPSSSSIFLLSRKVYERGNGRHGFGRGGPVSARVRASCGDGGHLSNTHIKNTHVRISKVTHVVNSREAQRRGPPICYTRVWISRVTCIMSSREVRRWGLPTRHTRHARIRISHFTRIMSSRELRRPGPTLYPPPTRDKHVPISNVTYMMSSRDAAHLHDTHMTHPYESVMSHIQWVRTRSGEGAIDMPNVTYIRMSHVTHMDEFTRGTDVKGTSTCHFAHMNMSHMNMYLHQVAPPLVILHTWLWSGLIFMNICKMTSGRCLYVHACKMTSGGATCHSSSTCHFTHMNMYLHLSFYTHKWVITLDSNRYVLWRRDTPSPCPHAYTLHVHKCVTCMDMSDTPSHV